MYKQTSFVITAVILLTAVVSIALYTVKAANAQGNMSSAGGANMTKGNMTGAAMGTAKNMTGNMTAGGAHGSKLHTTNPAGWNPLDIFHPK